MKKIAALLIDYGMDFHFEDSGSQGDKIISYEASLEITRQQGKIYYSYCGDEYVFEENAKTWEHCASLVEKALIEETT